MINKNLIKEILKVEDEANNIIYDAKKKARLIEAELEKEIGNINNRLEKEFNEKIDRLKASIQKEQNDEEIRLKNEFEEKRDKLSRIDEEDIEKMIDFIIKRICEA